MSTNRTFQSLRTTTDPSVVWNAPWPRSARSLVLPSWAAEHPEVGVGLAPSSRALSPTAPSIRSDSRTGRNRGDRSRSGSDTDAVSPNAEAMSVLRFVLADHLRDLRRIGPAGSGRSVVAVLTPLPVASRHDAVEHRRTRCQGERRQRRPVPGCAPGESTSLHEHPGQHHP